MFFYLRVLFSVNFKLQYNTTYDAIQFLHLLLLVFPPKTNICNIS